MFKLIGDFLNNITMYRLMLYFLVFLALFALMLSFFKLVPFTPIALLLSISVLVVGCWLLNAIFAKVFQAPANVESSYITALILALIITPANSLQGLLSLFWLAVLAMASKYILAIGKKHLFNPAALAVAVSAVTLNMGASWWVGSVWMMPAVLIIGLLIIRKIQRPALVFSFLLVALTVILGVSAARGNELKSTIEQVILNTPLLFFAFVMLTEPQTTPPIKILQIIYGGAVGMFLAFATPEVALLLGNVFSYLVSPKEKLILVLKEKTQIAPDVYDFVFSLDKKLAFIPGQYMEWTLSHPNPDNRGNRRYFTIASSPTENNLRIGVKFYPESSSFKKALISLDSTQQIVASQLSGDFTLPKDQKRKLVFIAGGIGITPFRSMVKYLLDINQTRDILLLFSNKSAKDIVYQDIFTKAQRIGLRTVYLLTDQAQVPVGWQGRVGYRVGYIDAKVIQGEAPDYKDRVFYISGPHSMVDVFEKTLKDMGINGKQIKVDYFPGYA